MHISPLCSRKDLPLFSSFLEFQHEHQHPPDSSKYKFPYPPKVVHLRKMALLFKRLSDLHITLSSLLAEAEITRRVGDPKTSQIPVSRGGPVSRAAFTRRPRQPASGAGARACSQAPSWSFSAAAARTALHASDRYYQFARSSSPSGKGIPPIESIYYLSGRPHPRRKIQSSNTVELARNSGLKPVDSLIRAGLDEDIQPQSISLRHRRILRLRRHSSQDLRKNSTMARCLRCHIERVNSGIYRGKLTSPKPIASLVKQCEIAIHGESNPGEDVT